MEGAKVSLLEEELTRLSVRSAKIVPNDNPSVLCSVWTGKIFNPDNFTTQMRSTRKIKGKFKIKVMGQNVFLISFEEENDLEHIMKGRPWLFRQQVILFERIFGPIERKQIKLTKSPF